MHNIRFAYKVYLINERKVGKWDERKKKSKVKRKGKKLIKVRKK